MNFTPNWPLILIHKAQAAIKFDLLQCFLCMDIPSRRVRGSQHDSFQKNEKLIRPVLRSSRRRHAQTKFPYICQSLDESEINCQATTSVFRPPINRMADDWVGGHTVLCTLVCMALLHGSPGRVRFCQKADLTQRPLPL